MCRDKLGFGRSASYSQLKSKVDNILVKVTVLRINLHDHSYIFTHTLTSPSHKFTTPSPHIHFPLLKYSLPPFHLVCGGFNLLQLYH